MKYKLKEEIPGSYVCFSLKMRNIPLIQAVLDESRFAIVIEPSQELIDLINDNCIGGEENTFNDAIHNMIKRLKFDLNDYIGQPIDSDRWEYTKYAILDRFNLCEKTFNMRFTPDNRDILFNDLFEPIKYKIEFTGIYHN